MKRYILCLIPLLTLVSCDSIYLAYLANKTGEPISVSIYFCDYDTSDTDGSKNTYIENLMKDTLLVNNSKLTLLRNKIAIVSFQLQNNDSIELISDTAPLREWSVEFDAIKISSNKDKIEIYGKSKILDSFVLEKSKRWRYLTITAHGTNR